MGASISSHDLVKSQVKIADSWLLSAFACCTEQATLIKRCFTFDGGSSGIYKLKLFKNGLPYHVTLDDYMPVDALNGKQAFCSSDKFLWASLLYKAFAKMHGGYHKLDNKASAYIEMTQ